MASRDAWGDLGGDAAYMSRNAAERQDNRDKNNSEDGGYRSVLGRNNRCVMMSKVALETWDDKRGNIGRVTVEAFPLF